MLLTFLQCLLIALVMALPVIGLVTAVDPASRRPGVGIKIDLRTGVSALAGGEIRILLLSTKNAADGSATVSTVLYEDLIDADAVGALGGVGGMAHLCAQRLFEEHPQAQLDAVFMAAASGASATGTITFDATSPIVTAQTVVVKIRGYTFTVVWEYGETAVQIATKLVTKITSLTRFLPVTAANGGGTLAVVTLTFKQKGTTGNDCKYSAVLEDGSGGTVTAAAAALASGTTEPSVALALALVAQREYRIIVPCLSNTDLAIATTASNMGLIKTHITGKNTGIGALLQTAHTACTDTTTNVKAMTNQHDFEYFSHHLIRGGLSLPCEWGGAICGIYSREISRDGGLNAAPNLIDTEFVAELFGGPESSALTAAEEEDLLQNGASYVGYANTRARLPRLKRPITTYFEDSDGNPDDRILDVSKPFGMIAVASDLRVYATRTFKGKKLVKTLPNSRSPIPKDIITESAAKTLLVGRIRSTWVPAGVVDEVKLDTVLEDGSLVVAVDPLDPTQLDFFGPLGIVPPLAKTSIVLVQA